MTDRQLFRAVGWLVAGVAVLAVVEWWRTSRTLQARAANGRPITTISGIYG